MNEYKQEYSTLSIEVSAFFIENGYANSGVTTEDLSFDNEKW